MQHHFRAAADALGLLCAGGDHLKARAPRGAPNPYLARPSPPARHLDLICDHEGGIKADTKLTDEAGAILGLRDPAHEGARARAGDGPEIIDQLLPIHTEPRIGHGQGTALLVSADADDKRPGVAEQIGLGNRLIAQLVARIGCIRDQLAQKDVAFGIDRMHHQPKQLGHFGLECMLLEGAWGIAAHGTCSWVQCERSNTAHIAARALGARPALANAARWQPDAGAPDAHLAGGAVLRSSRVLQPPRLLGVRRSRAQACAPVRIGHEVSASETCRKEIRASAWWAHPVGTTEFAPDALAKRRCRGAVWVKASVGYSVVDVARERPIGSAAGCIQLTFLSLDLCCRPKQRANDDQ